MTSAQKDKVLPAIFVQVVSALKYLDGMGFTYHTIGPESILVRTNMANGVPKVIIADLHYIRQKLKPMETQIGVTVWRETMLENFENERGYHPPEDYVPVRTFFIEERISWMLGATIYASLAGMPPYGFMKTLDGVVPWRRGKLQQVMKDMEIFKNNTYPPVETSNKHLATLMETLLTCDWRNRPSIKSLDLDIMKKLADGSGVKIMLGMNAATIWSMARSAARTINPFARN
ncbi:hypothetical protein THASP1DRAFT_28771 [Thamnocephalis sphaerospora]|uniref:Protein kinase domain-containing protein n=1 Tax=Thamnocephalis sphaerospora TaxID=78915 RepID=A0A4P9XTE2_9FUNG|nr:hypothetical protein THASP1DRAFT_28771 [Thamnocephalis sphaerospora]|eukprot:RKP09427.1 hypothetical protein THASP1DRAFT_28771 [Thamnocephalis sphaerospora]